MSGFTLAFGSMFSKTFRVHSIFTNIKLHKKVIKDYKLFLVVAILITFDICILTVWQIVDPFYRETNNGTGVVSIYQYPLDFCIVFANDDAYGDVQVSIILIIILISFNLSYPWLAIVQQWGYIDNTRNGTLSKQANEYIFEYYLCL